MFRSYLMCCCLTLITSSAVCAEYVQPDGSVIELRAIADATSSFYEDSSGFTAVQVPAEYHYALPSGDGGLEPSGIEVGHVDPKQSALPVHLKPAEEFLRKQRASGPQGYPAPNPNPIEVQRSDGAVIRLKLKSGGSYLWYEDEDGYAVVSTSARYEYALRNPDGVLIPSGILVGSMNPDEAGLKPRIRPASPR